MKSIAWNRPFSPPTEAKPQTMNDEYAHTISIEKEEQNGKDQTWPIQ